MEHAATAFRSGAALGAPVSQGSRAGSMRVRSKHAPHSLASRCHTASGASSSGRSFADAAQQQRRSGQASTSKYDRIVAFVDAHATPAAGSSIGYTCHTGEFEQPAWHNSYDEEAEEGEMDDEPQFMAFAAPAAAVAGAAAAAAADADVATVLVSSCSYGNLSNPKPWCYSWDEEAEGSFELAACVRLSPAQAERRATLHEARHAARLARKMRRSQLHPQLGDLEHMQAWVGAQEQLQKQQQQQRGSASSGLKYQQLLAFVAGDAASGQYRKPLQWHLTFDEDVHGPDAPDTVLGSC